MTTKLEAWAIKYEVDNGDTIMSWTPEHEVFCSEKMAMDYATMLETDEDQNYRNISHPFKLTSHTELEELRKAVRWYDPRIGRDMYGIKERCEIELAESSDDEGKRHAQTLLEVLEEI